MVTETVHAQCATQLARREIGPAFHDFDLDFFFDVVLDPRDHIRLPAPQGRHDPLFRCHLMLQSPVFLY